MVGFIFFGWSVFSLSSGNLREVLSWLWVNNIQTWKAL
jgi:hypothetical protein